MRRLVVSHISGPKRKIACLVRIPATLRRVALSRGPVYVERSGSRESGAALCKMVCSVLVLLVLVVLVRSGLPMLAVLVLVLVLMLAVLFVLAVLVLTVLVLLN